MKKAYAVLSEAFDQSFYFSDLSSDPLWDNGSSAKRIKDLLTRRLAVSRICCSKSGSKLGEDACYYGTAQGLVGNNDCFERPKRPNGTLITGGDFSNGDVTRSSFILKDGTAVTMKYQHRGVIHGFGINTAIRDGFGSSKGDFYEIFVDINGKTGPNMLGKDVHTFIYTKSHGLLPAGVDAKSSANVYGDCDEEYACTYDYLYPNDTQAS